jgi:LacI family transcriptional regulator
MPKATLKDVAEKANVSKTAASLILNGKSVRVSEETRLRVINAAQELQYVPNALIRSLQTQRTSTIGIYFGAGEDYLNVYIGNLFSSIRRAAGNAGYDTLVYRTGHAGEPLEASQFLDGRVDGLLYWGGVRSFNYEDAGRSGLPVVTLLEPSKVERLSSVLFDDGSGMRWVMQHLLKLGHRRIAYLPGRTTVPHLRYRLDLFTQTASSLTKEGLFASHLSNSDLLRISLKDRLLMPDRPTAIICAHEELADRCMQNAKEVGLSIPEQLSVVSWEDPGPTPSNFTCVKQDVQELGRKAVNALIHRILHPNAGPGEDIVIPVDFIQRFTTGSCPG